MHQGSKFSKLAEFAIGRAVSHALPREYRRILAGDRCHANVLVVVGTEAPVKVTNWWFAMALLPIRAFPPTQSRKVLSGEAPPEMSWVW